MFGMSMTELIIIGVLALILIGPDELPNAARTIGKTLKELRKAGDDLRDTFDKEIMQEVKDLKKPFDQGMKDIQKGFEPPPGVIAKVKDQPETKPANGAGPTVAETNTLPWPPLAVASSAGQVPPASTGDVKPEEKVKESA